MRDFYERYANILDDESIYSSPAVHETITNYRNHTRNRGKADLIDIYAQEITEIVKAAAEKTGGTWED